LQPGEADVAFHVTGAGAPRRIVEKSQAAADLDDRRQADARLRPGAVLTVEHDRFVRRIPVVEILAPVDPDRIGVLAAVYA